MNIPMVWVAASLAAAIVITATLLIATTTRGDPDLIPSPSGHLLQKQRLNS